MSKARDLADSAQEINILDGKSFLDEDNLASDSATGIASQQSIKAYVDGITTTNITSTGALNSGSITSGFGNIDNGSSTITTTGAITGGSFVIGSADINENDLESIDGITAGTVSASKAVVVNTNKDITGFRNLTATGTISGTLSGSLSSTTTATTQAESDDSTKIATTAYVVDKITTLIGGAPSTLNDLNELAAAINDDANYNSTLTTALATKLPLAGGTMTGDVLYNDNIKAKFGAGSDLQIYHSSSTNNSVIQETGSGNLLIYASNISMADAGGNEFILMTDTGTGGTVELKHNTSTKLATTSTGIDVTGTVANSSGNLTLDANAEMIFDSNGANWRLKDNGTQILHISRPTGQVKFFASVQDSDIVFGGMDGTSPITALTLDMSAAGKATFNSGVNVGGILELQSNNDGFPTTGMVLNQNNFVYLRGGSNGLIIGKAGDNEAMRIDTSGNLIIGKQNTSIGTVGTTLGESGFITATRSGNPVLNLNRTSSDGPIADFYRGDVLKGSINIFYSNLMIGKESGARISFGDTDIYSTNNAGSTVDNAYDLGSTNSRFRECHAVNFHGDGSNLTGVGGSTAFGAVGTYTAAYTDSGSSASDNSGGATIAGSSLRKNNGSGSLNNDFKDTTGVSGTTSAGLSGTWRYMSRAKKQANEASYAVPAALFVRIS